MQTRREKLSERRRRKKLRRRDYDQWHRTILSATRVRRIRLKLWALVVWEFGDHFDASPVRPILLATIPDIHPGLLARKLVDIGFSRRSAAKITSNRRRAVIREEEFRYVPLGEGVTV